MNIIDRLHCDGRQRTNLTLLVKTRQGVLSGENNSKTDDGENLDPKGFKRANNILSPARGCGMGWNTPLARTSSLPRRKKSAPLV